MFDEITQMLEEGIAILVDLIKQRHTLSCAVSGGKDSTVVLVMALEAIRRVAASGMEQPPHHVTTASTTVENPSMLGHLELMLTEIEEYAATAGLPISVHIAEPTLASQFVVSTIGRGTLARTLENSNHNGKAKRPCSQSWKVDPQNRLRAQLEKSAGFGNARETITLLGTRFEESPSRKANMRSRGESAIKPVRSAAGNLTLSPIADWSVTDVWEVVAMFTNAATPFPSPVSARTMERMADLYRAGNEGTCGVVLGDGGNKAACGSRFGCAVCLISGDKDRSMESMVQEPEHAYMAGLNKFRNYLLATQWDMSRRELVGRKLSKAGYIRVQADTLSFNSRIELLKYLCTLDALEIERAEQMDEDLASGRVPDTPANRELCSVRFEMVTPRQLVAIDFMLSMHHYAPHAFPALSVWYDVHKLGRRYHIPDVKKSPKVPIELHGWYHVGQYDAEVPVDGLRDYKAEMWSPYLHPDRLSAHAQTTSGERVVYFEETDLLEVDAEAACAFVTCTFDTQFMLRSQQFPGMDSARFWLNQRILTLPADQSQRYQEMAKRGQYFAHLAEKLNCTPRELDEHLIRNAISDKEHASKLETPYVEIQFDLFAEAA
ncbi:phosphoadenosine phosphosulfate reductase family protein [Paraburkholderia sp. SIMBA_054]|uniref:phosphoadenosine phosphosulfate reductase domain-containing protein n=1 Tax=Paraburkholderia sp. SIMBA_054 TaxID=3085795 RepID=UPI00397E2FC8